MKRKTKATEALSRQPIIVDFTALFCCECTIRNKQIKLMNKLSLMTQGGSA